MDLLFLHCINSAALWHMQIAKFNKLLVDKIYGWVILVALSGRSIVGNLT